VLHLSLTDREESAVSDDELEHIDLSADLGLRSGDDSIGATDPEKSRAWIWFWTLASVAGMGTGAYHGYKRNDSVGWAIGWAVVGGIFPVVTIPVSIAQGFGKRKPRRRGR